MKRLLLVLAVVLGVSVLASAQWEEASYDAQPVTIDLGRNIEYYQILLKMNVEPDGVYQYFPVAAVDQEGSKLTLYLADYQPYIVYYKLEGDKFKTWLKISTYGNEVSSDWDLSIKTEEEMTYRFEKGILVFNY